MGTFLPSPSLLEDTSRKACPVCAIPTDIPVRKTEQSIVYLLGFKRMETSVSMRMTACWQPPTTESTVVAGYQLCQVNTAHSTCRERSGSWLRHLWVWNNPDWANKTVTLLFPATYNHHKLLCPHETPRLSLGLSQALLHPELCRGLNEYNGSKFCPKENYLDLSLG